METVQIHNAITGEYSEREATANEMKEHADRVTDFEAEAEAQAAKALAREALLTRLGITSEEAQLLLGGI